MLLKLNFLFSSFLLRFTFPFIMKKMTISGLNILIIIADWVEIYGRSITRFASIIVFVHQCIIY